MLVLLAAACSKPPPLILMVSWDTTRADALGSWGGEGTPNADALASSGVVFDWALSGSSTTLASHASVFSGRDSHGTGVVRNGYPVPDGLPLLQERFAEAGWDTWAVVGSTALEERMGLARGFRTWTDHDLVPYLQQYEVGADVVNLRALEQLRNEPTFAFVHYYDAHGPWNSAPPELRCAWSDCDYTGPVATTDQTIHWLSDQDNVATLTDTDREQARGLYRAEVAWVDQNMGKLFESLGRRMDNALVVLFADHGETMDGVPGHGYGHGPDVDLDIIHVPLIIAGTGDFAVPDGMRVERQVRLMDLGTTVLSASGLGGILGEGEDLSRLWRGETPIAPPNFAEATKPIAHESKTAWNNLPFERSVAEGGLMVVKRPLYGDLGLFSLAEGQPFVDDIEKAKELDKKLMEWDATAPPHREPNMSAQTENALRALGYLDD